jgi:uncharacterized protein YhbP (UPF0306 family)
MAIERSQRRIAADRLGAAARSLLDASTLCAIATAAPGGRAYVNTAYFAWSDAFEIVWLSHPDARHSRNIDANRSAAVAVFDSTQTWGNPDRGVQLFGSARIALARAHGVAEAIYASRFPDYGRDEFSAYRLYMLRPRQVKLFDERALGAGVFVTAKVDGGRLAWQRTDRYRATD